MLLPGAEFFKVKTQESHLGIPYECLATEAPDVPKTIQANVIVLVAHQNQTVKPYC